MEKNPAVEIAINLPKMILKIKLLTLRKTGASNNG